MEILLYYTHCLSLCSWHLEVVKKYMSGGALSIFVSQNPTVCFPGGAHCYNVSQPHWRG